MTRYTTLDLPQLARASVGFDRMFREMDRVFENSKTTSYPPYNIVKLSDDEFMISVAVAGFNMSDLDITLEKNVLTIQGTSPDTKDEVDYLHKGIGSRNFTREFTLADYIEVESASLELGMLNVHLKRYVPEEMQPKKIAITEPNLIEG
jgi:molecular chaperone IbpA